MNLQAWAQRAEIVASCAVVITLIFLIAEVRNNTLAIERQATLDRTESLASPFLTNPELARVLAKVKKVDGAEPLTRALSERYALTAEESILWARHLHAVWHGLEADYLYSGPSEWLDRYVKGLLLFPDGQIYWQYENAWHDADFRSYVERTRENP